MFHHLAKQKRIVCVAVSELKCILFFSLYSDGIVFHSFGENFWFDKRSFICFYFHINLVIGLQQCRNCTSKQRNSTFTFEQRRSDTHTQTITQPTTFCRREKKSTTLNKRLKYKREKCNVAKMYHFEWQNCKAPAKPNVHVPLQCGDAFLVKPFFFSWQPLESNSFVRHYRSGGYAYLFHSNIKQNKSIHSD